MSTMIVHNMCCAFDDADPADLVGSQNNPLGANFMWRKLSAAFAKVPVGDQPGLCQCCERKGRHVCRHGLCQVFALSGHIASRRDKLAEDLWAEFCREHPDKAADQSADVDPGYFSSSELEDE
eukprot:1510238-Rhodomonas_salina.1